MDSLKAAGVARIFAEKISTHAVTRPELGKAVALAREIRVSGAAVTLVVHVLIPDRTERTCPRAVKRARHNNYRVKKPGEPASIRHTRAATILLHSLNPRAA